jgi:hypothetical protein
MGRYLELFGVGLVWGEVDSTEDVIINPFRIVRDARGLLFPPRGLIFP